MQLVEPYAKILNVPDLAAGIRLLRNVEYYARVSHRSEESATDDSWERFIRAVVLGHGDFSVIEHEVVNVEMLVDRGITHEIVRHRLASYTQESTRFVNYQKKGGEAKFVCPFTDDGTLDSYDCAEQWKLAMQMAEKSYMYMIDRGVKPQIARSVFPNALASKIICTMNLRTWRHFFLMRTSAEAHPQMKQVTVPLLAQFQQRIPVLYEDIVPGNRQIENMRLAR
jgi:thymidylate synthase (FAD)